jgi:hypothetical protein
MSGGTTRLVLRRSARTLPHHQTGTAMPPDEYDLDTVIQDIISAPEATRLMRRKPEPPRRPHPVIRFEAGTILFLVIAILGYVLVWLLRHG